MRTLLRQAGWGLAAIAALLVAVLSGNNERAVQKLIAAFSSSNEASAQPRFDAEIAARQLAQAVRGLAADRDELAQRIHTVEREMDDMTGSVKRQIEEAKTGRQTPPWPEDAAPVPLTAADVAAMAKSVAPAPILNPTSPPPVAIASASAATATPEPATPTVTGAITPAAAGSPAAAPAMAYGADIGTATTMKALRARWVTLRKAHPQLFVGLRPLVSLKQPPHADHAELHLVVGPYANAEAASQFCDFVVPFHLVCQPAMFDGSRLSLQ